MIKCIMKKFIIFFMIISMSIPSFSTLYQSDGSNFVTKAEFDSSMVDFNSRLTTFETGINLKIDSQVTSYLDRNGIWSRASQTVLTTTVNFPALGTLSPDTGTINFEKYTALNNLFTSNKSGLAFYRTYYWTTNGNTANSWWGWGFNAYSNKQVTKDYLLATIDFYEGNVVNESKIKSSWLIGNVSDTANANNNSNVWNAQICLMIALPAEKVYNNIMFFVDKGKTYTYRFYARGQINNCYQTVTRTHGGQFGTESIDVY